VDYGGQRHACSLAKERFDNGNTVKELYRDGYTINYCYVLQNKQRYAGWLGSRVVSLLDSGAEGPGFISQQRRCRVTVSGKLFTPIVPLFAKQQNW